MADDERLAEVEAVKRTRPKVGALIGAWRRYADDLEVALDRVRDARDDETPKKRLVVNETYRDARGDDERGLRP